METLPTEILLDILSHLPYNDLKRLQQTCRHLHTIISSHASLNSTLFRDVPATGEIDHNHTIFQIHPVFKYLSYPFSSNPNSITIPPHNTPLSESSVRYENATSPAVRKLTIAFRNDWRAVVVESPTRERGVTVWDVMRSMAVDIIGFIETNATGAMPRTGVVWGGIEHWEYVGSGLLVSVRDPEEDEEEEEDEDEEGYEEEY